MLEFSGIAATRRRIAPFQLCRPDSLRQACESFAEAPGDTAVLAGGIDLANRLKAGYAPRRIVALNAVKELQDIRVLDDRIEIGAAVSHWQVENHEGLKGSLPCLPAYVSGLGNIRVRVQGTIGGNIMAAEPAYEMLPLLGVLGAKLNIFIMPERRWSMLSIPEFMGRSPAASLLASITIPRRCCDVVWDRQLRPSLGLVLSVEWCGDVIQSAIAALTGDRSGPVFASLETSGLGRADALASLSGIVSEWASRFPSIRPVNGPSADYCREVSGVMLRRAFHRILIAE